MLLDPGRPPRATEGAFTPVTGAYLDGAGVIEAVLPPVIGLDERPRAWAR
jgi:hypothetical protein